MKLWLTKNSEVSVREQLATQIALGIASGDLTTGEKLPSTREISRRFGVHANTVSSAYQKLCRQGLIEFRKGSGFFVCANKTNALEGQFKLDWLIAEFFQSAQKLGFSVTDIQNHLQKWLDFQSPEYFLVIESDEFLRDIIVEEIRSATGFPVEAMSFEKFQEQSFNTSAIFVAMIDEMAKIQTILPPGKTCVYLKARSVPDSMTGASRPNENDLIVIVSDWEKFLIWSKMFLVAANVSSDSILLRSTKEKAWRNGLKHAAMIICDSLTAKNFTSEKRVRIFRIIADDSLNELRRMIENSF